MKNVVGCENSQMEWEEEEKKSEKIEWPQPPRHLLRRFFFTGHYLTACRVGGGQAQASLEWATDMKTSSWS